LQAKAAYSAYVRRDTFVVGAPFANAFFPGWSLASLITGTLPRFLPDLGILNGPLTSTPEVPILATSYHWVHLPQGTIRVYKQPRAIYQFPGPDGIENAPDEKNTTLSEPLMIAAVAGGALGLGYSVTKLVS
jgi:hypothetical protein